ncbi:MAG: CHAT domain-containing tetratricopeptide repeat protein [Bacteroidota bacterium]|nr:CHAT domain-containing tetratricopeptide repeat protein [Bacteroidota bacterium]
MKRSLFFYLFIFVAITAHSQTYESRLKNAQQEYNKGNFKKAFEITDQIVRDAEKNKKIDQDELTSIKSEHATYMAFNDKYDESMKIFDALFNNLGSLSEKTRIHLRKNYGTALAFYGDYREALSQFESALELAKKIGIDKDEHISLLSSLAQCSQFIYEFKRSENYLKEAIAYCEKNGMSKTFDHAVLYSTLGLLYKDMLLESRSMDAYATAQELFTKQTDTLNVDFANFLLNYASSLGESGQLERSLSLLYRTRNIHLNLFGENSPEYAVVLNNMGYVFSKNNKFIETEQYYTRAIELKKKIPSVKILSYLNTQNNLMVFYSNAGRKEEAKEMIAELERGLKDPKLDDTLSRATFAQNLGQQFRQMNEREKALKYYQDAIYYYNRIYGPGNELSGDIYLAMSYVSIDANNFEKANEYIQLATQSFTPALMKGDANTIFIICNIVGICNAVKTPSVGQTLIDQAIELLKLNSITDEEAKEQVYITKALNAADLDDIKVSIDYFNKYLNLKYSQMQDRFRYMSENEKLSFMDNMEQNVKNYYAVALNFIDKNPAIVKSTLNFRLRSKGLLLNNVSKLKNKITELNDEALNKKFETLKTDRENITKLMNLNTTEYPDALDQIETLKKEANQLEKDISLKVSDLTKTETTTWEPIQKQLLPNEAAIEIIRTNLIYPDGSEGSNYSYIIIPSKGDPFVVVIDRKVSWEDEVLTLYRNSINDQKNEPDLYRRLWKHVNDKIKGITTVYISPDGIYNQVNLNTLLNGETNEFAIEEKNIHYITTLKDLAYLKQNANRKPVNATLVGNPTFDYDLTSLPTNKQEFGNSIAVRSAYGFKLEQLPGTKTEVETIKTLLDNNGIKTTLLTEEKANEAAVKKIKDPDVVHFATHGFFLEDFSEEVLAEYSRTEQDYFRNPMMRSGVFFSGANKTYSINTTDANSLKEFEDGTLTAFEAMGLNLDKTELVVLSACQTGLGKVKNGEGVFGLQRAFKLAGAKSIIMSLWPVSDDATKELMINFYSGWTKTGDLYTSFKNAQLEVKKKFPQPYYWGAFVLYGK